MHPLLRYTLDLFESNQPLAGKNKALSATEIDQVAPIRPAKLALPPSLTPPVFDSVPASDKRPASGPVEAAAQDNFRHPRASRETRLDGQVVAFEFKRGQRRTIGFSVGPDGLVVHAPKWVALHEVERALQTKAAWILRKLIETRSRDRRQADQQVDWRDGVTLPWLGDTLTVVLGQSPFPGVRAPELTAGASGPVLRLALAPVASPEHIRNAVQAWLLPQARRLFIERLDHFAPQLQVQWRTLALTNAKTRWGSARIDGAIRLNWRLMHFPMPVVDYVVAHELSHLRVMDHSPRFWDTVRSVVPNYTELRRQLKADTAPRWG
jgi:predicted metal-dependent hydrolase